MKNLDEILDLLTKHWEVLSLLLVGAAAGAYRIARWRTSGLRKVLNAHDEILEDLSTRLHRLRLELEVTREDLSQARAKGYEAAAEVARLQARVTELENRERELLLKMNNT